MSTPTIRAALERLVALSKQHAIASVWDGAFFNARAALAAATSGDGLAPRVLAMCKQRKWSLHWTSRGAYLHLEASELIEALRGKRGDPLAEAADVLLVLMSITENAGIDWSAVVQQTAATCSRLEACDHYPGEERMDSPAAPAAPEVGSPAALATWLRNHSGQCVELGRPDWAHMAGRAADTLEAFSLGGWIVPSAEEAAPAAPAPKPGEVGELVAQLGEDGKRLIAAGYANASVETRDLGIRVTRAAALLQQQAAPAPAVVPVEVDLKEKDFDAEGRCWHFMPGFPGLAPEWRLIRPVKLGPFVSHRAPAHAIPLPQGGEGEA